MHFYSGPPTHFLSGVDKQGRAVGLKRELVGPAKPKRRERSEGPTAVRLADSTPRSGEPATWGSGQRALNCSKATWPPCKGGYGHLCKEMNRRPWKQDSNE